MCLLPGKLRGVSLADIGKSSFWALDAPPNIGCGRISSPKPSVPSPVFDTDEILLFIRRVRTQRLPTVIFIGASTGGPDAIKNILQKLPLAFPPILIAQHMPANFTKSFANRLNQLCQITVKEAEDDEIIRDSCAYIAPGNAHLMIDKKGTTYKTKLSFGKEVNRHKPSVDVLFRSGANVVSSSAIGIILTGIGKDGAKGMLEMSKNGAFNIAQDEKTSVVFGMPKEAIKSGGVNEIIALDDISARLISLVNGKAF